MGSGIFMAPRVGTLLDYRFSSPLQLDLINRLGFDSNTLSTRPVDE